MLAPYRRHLDSCPHRGKGQHFTLCSCPVWAYGRIATGQVIRQSLKTNDWGRALQRLENWSRGGDTSPEIAAAVPALGKATEAFLADAKARNLRKSTLGSYKMTFRHLKEALGESRSLAAIDVPTLGAWRTARKVKPRTARKELEHLRAFFRWCKDRDWILRNPATKLKMPLVSDVATLPFTPDEVRRLIAACDLIASDNPAETPYIRHRARAILYALLYSGLRVGDVARLRRASLDESSRYLALRTTKTGVPVKIPLHPDAVKALVTLPAENPEFFFWTGHGEVERCGKNMWRTVQRLGKLAKVDNARPHRFRDTFAVELLTTGADIRTVQQLLGHDSVRTTEKHYAHFVAAHQKLLDVAAARLDFGPKPARPLLVKTRQNRRRNA